MEEHTLAYEMLGEIKRSNKRWFSISIIELIIIVSMVIGFFIYESQFACITTTEQTQEAELVTSSNMTQTIN